MRAMTSVALPGVSGMTTFTGLVGHACAETCVDALARSAASAIAAAVSPRVIVASPLNLFFWQCSDGLAPVAMRRPVADTSGHLVDQGADVLDPDLRGVASFQELPTRSADAGRRARQ